LNIRPKFSPKLQILVSKPNIQLEEEILLSAPNPLSDVLPEHQSSRLLWLLLNNTDDSFILIDSNLKVTLFNEKAADRVWLYFNIKLHKGYPILNLVTKDRRPHFAQLLGESFQGIKNEAEALPITVNNEPVYLHNSFKPIFDTDGSVMAVMITSKDITETKLAEAVLRESEERWRFALDGSNHGLWDWNMKTDSMFFSKSFKQLYAIPDEELGDHYRDWQERVHPDDKEKVEKDIQTHTTSNNPYYESTYRILANNGEFKWILARGLIISKDDSGAPLRMLGTHTDISSQKSAEESYKTLFYSHPNPMWTYEAGSLNITEVNDAAIELYGFTREEFLSLTIMDLRTKEDSGALTKILAEITENVNGRMSKVRHQKKDGSQMFVEVSSRRLNGQNKKLRLVSINDITDKVRAEEALKKSNERYQLTIKATSDAIYDWDLVTNNLTWGEGLTVLFNHPTTAVSMAIWETLVHPDDRKRVVQSLAQVLKNTKKKLWKARYRFQKQDGTYSNVLEKGFIIRTEDGTALRMIGALQDITELMQQEEALKKSNDRYHYAALATAEVIWDWDIENGLIQLPENLTNVFGWELPENNLVPDSVILQHFHSAEKERVLANLQNCIKDSSVNYVEEEFQYQQANGTYSYVTTKAHILRNEAGRAIRMIGATRDITEKRYRTQLLELERQTLEQSTQKNVAFKTVVTTLLQGLETLHPGIKTSVALLTDDQKIQHLAAPSLPPEIIDKLNGLEVGPTSGSGGAAMFTRQTITVDKIATSPLFDSFKAELAAHELTSAWSAPIVDSAGIVIGAFSVYYTAGFAATPTQTTSMQRAKNLLRILLENHFSIKKLRLANERHSSVLKATHDLIWDWDLETGTFYRDKQGTRKVYGVKNCTSIENFPAWLSRIHPDDHKRVKTAVNTIINDGQKQVLNIEYRFKRDDGEYNYVYDRGFLIRNAEGQPTRMIGAAQDITVQKELEQQLVQRELEKQKIIGQATIETQEQERSEIGKELHDNVNQILTTTKLYLDLSISNPEMKDELILKSSKNIIYVINEIRQLSRSLMNPSLGDLGLVDSVNDLIENIHLTRKLNVVFNAADEVEGVLNEQQKLTFFRILQEGLNNAMKHANATLVTLNLRLENNFVCLAMEDDGVGFDPQLVKKGSGLKNIQNRVYLSNGTINLKSSAGNGCIIEIRIPVPTKNTN